MTPTRHRRHIIGMSYAFRKIALIMNWVPMQILAKHDQSVQPESVSGKIFVAPHHSTEDLERRYKAADGGVERGHLTNHLASEPFGEVRGGGHGLYADLGQLGQSGEACKVESSQKPVAAVGADRRDKLTDTNSNELRR